MLLCFLLETNVLLILIVTMHCIIKLKYICRTSSEVCKTLKKRFISSVNNFNTKRHKNVSLIFAQNRII